ncbi:hypothetical protein Csa_016017, partial [Cucumis sativus]
MNKQIQNNVDIWCIYCLYYRENLTLSVVPNTPRFWGCFTPLMLKDYLAWWLGGLVSAPSKQSIYTILRWDLFETHEIRKAHSAFMDPSHGQE